MLLLLLLLGLVLERAVEDLGGQGGAVEGEVFGDEGGEEHDGRAVIEAGAVQERLAAGDHISIVFEDGLEGWGRVVREGRLGLHDLERLSEGANAIAAGGELGGTHLHRLWLWLFGELRGWGGDWGRGKGGGRWVGEAGGVNGAVRQGMLRVEAGEIVPPWGEEVDVVEVP